MVAPDHAADTAGSAEGQLFYRDLIRSVLSDQQVRAERYWLQQLIEEELHPAGRQFILLSGEPGTGKTHLLAQIAANKPDALRYFLRSDSRNSLAYGDARTFLLRIGHQLAALHPEAFPEAVDLAAEQDIDTIAEGGTATGVRIESMHVSPFHITALHVRQRVRLIQGDLVGIDVGQMISDPEMLSVPVLERLAVRRPAELLHAQAGRLVVIIDALDETRFAPGLTVGATIVDWLASAPALPEMFQFVIATRPDSLLLQRLRSSRAGELVEIVLGDFAIKCADDVTEYVRNALTIPEIANTLARESIAAGWAAQVITSRSQGNFQYAATVVRALNMCRRPSSADAENLPRPISAKLLLGADSALPGSLERLYAHYLALLGDQCKSQMVEVVGQDGVRGWAPIWQAVYQSLLSVLAVARSPLSTQEILEFTGMSVSGKWLREALASLSQFLSSENDRYQLFHPSIGSFLTSNATDTLTDLDCHVDAGQWHRHFVDVLAGDLSNPNKGMSPYAKLHLAFHAYKAGRLRALLESPRFLIDAEPDGLIGLLAEDLLTTDGPARAYISVYDVIRDLDENGKSSYLELACREFGLLKMANAIAETKSWGDWSIRWTQSQRQGGYRRVLPATVAFSTMATSWVVGRPAIIGVLKGTAEIRAYELLTGQYLLGCQPQLGAQVTAIAVTASQVRNLLALGTLNGCIYTLDFDSGTLTGGPWQQHEGTAVQSITIEYDGRSIYIVSTDDTGTAKCLDAATGERVDKSAVTNIQPDETSAYGITLPPNEYSHIVVKGVDSEESVLQLSPGHGIVLTDEDGNQLPVRRTYKAQVDFIKVGERLALVWSTSSRHIRIIDFHTCERLFGLESDAAKPIDLSTLQLSSGDCAFALTTSRSILGFHLSSSLQGSDKVAENHHLISVNRDRGRIESISMIEVNGKAVIVWLDSEGGVSAHEMGAKAFRERESSSVSDIGRLHSWTVNGRTVIACAETYGIVDGGSIVLSRGTEGAPGKLLLLDPHNGHSLGQLVTLNGGSGILDFALCQRGGDSFLAFSSIGAEEIILVNMADFSLIRIDASALGIATALVFDMVNSRPCLFAGGNGGVIICYALDSLEPIDYFQGGHGIVVDFTLMRIDGRLVVASTTWGTSMVAFNYFDSGELLFERAASAGGSVSALHLEAESDILATGDTRGFVRLQQLSTGRTILEFFVGARILGLTLIDDGIAVSTPQGVAVYNLHFKL